MTLIVLLSEAHPYCTQHGRAIVTHTEDKENDTLAGRSKLRGALGFSQERTVCLEGLTDSPRGNVWEGEPVGVAPRGNPRVALAGFEI